MGRLRRDTPQGNHEVIYEPNFKLNCSLIGRCRLNIVP